MPNAIRMMKDRQKAMFSVLLAFRTIARRAMRSDGKADFTHLKSLLEYLDRFPEKLHQPNEERYLFKAVLSRDPGLSRVVARAQRDHAASKGYLVRLRAALKDWEDGVEGGLAQTAIVADDYVRFARRHARIEERDLLSVARNVLGQAEWADIERVFGAAADPLAVSKSRQECTTAIRKLSNLPA
ncbi:Hemerythrin-like domain-containing protein [Enhydrobacter aerosaccus]|uniref:Hemerythrin-like domain-containing protein n=1 Tax=Enhydrobacter aerosaccus TaxID=225324 RepID=A0A1T4R8J6_9HYPH|nr:hemerythrin domain-containing protein [Enhydrobacter aerosaccus]SKA12344.1 Hemerythrin-like domain-containing protein [Enhydrobacter aerosaccus]